MPNGRFFRPGYVVLAAAPADTLRGETDLYRASQAQPKVYFRLPGGTTRLYTPDELVAAGDATGRDFRRCLVPKGEGSVQALLEVLVAGPTSLLFDPTGKLPATYYLAKPGDMPLPLTRTQFAQVLRTSFADCPTANTTVAYMDKYMYSAKDLRRYVINYNRCVHPEAPVHAQDIAADKEPVRWGVQAGLARLHIFYPYTYIANQKAMPGPVTPTFGLTLNLPLNSFFSFATGLTYSSFRSDNTFRSPYQGTSYIQTSHYQTKGTLLRWPITFRYTLRRPEHAWRPYAQGGVQMSYLLNSRLSRQITYDDPTVPLVANFFSESMDGLGRGLYGETGLQLRWRTALLGAGLRYEQTIAFPVRGRGGLTDSRQFSLVLSYSR